jgi:hypothetical protein
MLLEVWLLSLPILFPISRVLFGRPFSWYFEWPSLLTLCMLDTWLLAVIIWAFFHALINDLSRVYRISSQIQSYITTDGQSASLSWCQRLIWVLGPDLYCCQTVEDLLIWGALSDERTGLPFKIVAGPRQRSHSWARVPRDSQIRDSYPISLINSPYIAWS